MNFRWVIFGLSVVFSVGCGASWTPEDKAASLSAEAMFARIYALDAGPMVESYSRAGLCAIQASLAQHDAGRLVGPIHCVQVRN